MAHRPILRRRRKYTPVERRYVVEAVQAFWPDAIYKAFNVRLGRPPEELRRLHPELDRRWMKVWLPCADAIVVTDTHLYVVEAKIRNPRQAIGQLLDYVRRVPETPELAPYAGRPIVAVLVVPFADPELVKTCKQFNIDVREFRPKWVEEYMKDIGLLPRE